MEYSGDICSKDAFEILSKDENSILVDVRTQDEWKFVGEPNLDELGKKHIKISWIFLPEMRVNENFLSELNEELSKKAADEKSKIFFLCKSGGRSKAAAVAAAKVGYKNCYNIEDGFEGNQNLLNPLKTANGWKAENLPWKRD